MSSKKIHNLNINAILQRIGEIIKSQKNVDIAKIFGVNAQTSANWKSQKRNTIPWEKLFRFSVNQGISLNWLLTGKEVTPKVEGFTLVPKYQARLSGGPGAYVLAQDIESHLSFKNSWLNGKCQRERCALFEIRGDSMSPLITDGDIVLVDMSKNVPEDLIDGKIYAFSEGDKVKIKRLVWRGSDLWAISENKTEAPDAAIDKDGFNLIGKVIWVGHEVR